MESLITLDQELFLFLNGLGSNRFDQFWMLMTHRGSNVLVYVSIILLLSLKIKKKQIISLVIFGLILILVTDQLTNLCKVQVGRLRPCFDFQLKDLVRLVKSSCGGKFSFFSGHASNSFALAFFFGRVVKRHFKMVNIILIFIAGLISYSRIYIGVHYPLDIVCGMVVGSIIGIVFYRIWEKTNYSSEY